MTCCSHQHLQPLIFLFKTLTSICDQYLSMMIFIPSISTSISTIKLIFVLLLFIMFILGNIFSTSYGKNDLRFLFEHFWTLLSHKSQGSKSQQQSGYRSYASSQIDNEHHSPTPYKKEKSKALHAMSEYIPLLCPDFCLH